MLAFLPAERQEAFFQSMPLAPLTSKTITDQGLLRQELKKIQKQGCAVSFGEWIEDAAGVAAPIFDAYGMVFAALSISGPIQRFHSENVSQYCIEAKRFAARISEGMGYTAGVNNSSRSEENDDSR
jgi:DNA-binding IclR family transcriptional regulator